MEVVLIRSDVLRACPRPVSEPDTGTDCDSRFAVLSESAGASTVVVGARKRGCASLSGGHCITRHLDGGATGGIA